MTGKYMVSLITALALFLGTSSVAQDDFFATGEQTENSEKQLVDIVSQFSYSSAMPGRTYPAAVVIDISEGWHINSADPNQEWLIPLELSIDTLPGIVPGQIVYPEGHELRLADELMSVLDGRAIVYFQVTVADEFEAEKASLPISVTYQMCNDRECLPPESQDITVEINIGAEGEPVAEDIFGGLAAITPDDARSAGVAQEESDLQRLINEYGFWGYFMALGLAFITGLLLSFSPCTYPMIPITVSIFAGQDRTVGRGFVLSLFYVGSMAVVYGLMGLIVSLVGGVFGAWLASPPVVIGIAVIFVVFSLSMFGLYELNVPASLRQKLGGAKSGGGIVGSIILGIVAALVVSPCVGPFVAGILIYIATTGSPVVGFLVLFVFAIGLGTLFIIIGTFSSAINALPRAGEWMDSVRKFFGFVLLLMAIYFLRTIIPPTVSAVLTGILLLVLGVFGGGFDRLTPDSSMFHRLKKLVGVVAFLFGLYFLMGTVIVQGVILPPLSQWLPASTASRSETADNLIPWMTDLDAGLQKAAAENKPVLIDTWATWCVNCKVLEKKTFNHPDVVAEARDFIPLKIQLETAGTPETRAFMERFGWKTYSLPTTLILNSSGETVHTLRGVVDPEEMIARMRDAAK